jgi:hypothetical protein
MRINHGQAQAIKPVTNSVFENLLKPLNNGHMHDIQRVAGCRFHRNEMQQCEHSHHEFTD